MFFDTTVILKICGFILNFTSPEDENLISYDLSEYLLKLLFRKNFKMTYTRIKYAQLMQFAIEQFPRRVWRYTELRAS